MSDDLDELYQSVDSGPLQGPRNFHALEGANRKGEGFNPFAAIITTVFLKMGRRRLRDMQLSGSGCCFQGRRPSLWTATVKGKSPNGSEGAVREVHDMITTGTVNDEACASPWRFCGRA